MHGRDRVLTLLTLLMISKFGIQGSRDHLQLSADGSDGQQSLLLDTYETCSPAFCFNHSLYILPWSECSQTCGTGYQTREVVCKDNMGLIVDSSHCNIEESLIESQPCNTEPCGTFYWTLPRWSICDAPCGGGKKRRIPTCHSTLDSDSNHMQLCSGRQPDIESVCFSQPCQSYTWLLGAWEECPYACDATVTRVVQCVDGYGFERDDSMCFGKKPVSEISCRYPNITTCGECWQDCYGNGVCEQGVCSCSKGWSGKYCQIPSPCKANLGYSSLNHVRCCHLVDVAHKCCLKSTATLDKDGSCCESGIVDAFGVCNGNATMIDSEGRPCTSIRDEKGICCESGIVDECHVCDGDGSSCSTRMTLLLNITGYSGGFQDSSAFSSFILSTMDHVAMRLNVADEALDLTKIELKNAAGEECNLTQLETSPCVDEENEVLKGVVTVDVTVAPVNRETFIRKKDIMVALQPGPLAPFEYPQVLDAELFSVENIRRVGVCGNGVCERGERCNSDGSSASTNISTCCLQDCPYVPTVCPSKGMRNIPCSSKGICIDSSGQCDCFEGYGGADCSECIKGCIRTQVKGICMKLPDNKTLANLASIYTGSSSFSLPLKQGRRKGTTDLVGVIIIIVLCAIGLVLIILLAIAIRISKRRSPTVVVNAALPRVTIIDIPPSGGDSENESEFPKWSSSYLGPPTDYDIIPITPMLEKCAMKFDDENDEDDQDSRIPSTSYLTAEEDFTEEEQTKIVEKLKKEIRRGKSSAVFVTDYLSDESDDDDDDDDDSQTRNQVNCTPDSRAVQPSKSNPTLVL